MPRCRRAQTSPQQAATSAAKALASRQTHAATPADFSEPLSKTIFLGTGEANLAARLAQAGLLRSGRGSAAEEGTPFGRLADF